MQLAQTVGADLYEYAFRNIIDPERFLGILSPSAVRELKAFYKANEQGTSALERHLYYSSNRIWE